MSPPQEARIHELRPTQLTVGLHEVAAKRKHLEALTAPQRRAFLQQHPIPAVRGPQGRLYITDHHHLGRAALEAGIETACVQIEADLSGLTTDAFWDVMNSRQWVHPLDENGVRHHYAAIPNHLDKLVDDVYRALAGFVRDAGGYAKTPTAFAEFVWADFFRRQIAIEDVRADFHAALRAALLLARGELARGLPGRAD